MFTQEVLPVSAPVAWSLGAILPFRRRRFVPQWGLSRRFFPGRQLGRKTVMTQPPWRPTSPRWRRSGLSAVPGIRVAPATRAQRTPAAFTAAVEAKEATVRQGRWMQPPTPHIGALLAHRARQLMTSQPRLPVRGFATRFKQRTIQRINRIPSSNIPGEARIHEPNYVRNVEVIAFASAPPGSLDRSGDRDGRYRMADSGFLRSRLSF